MPKTTTKRAASPQKQTHTNPDNVRPVFANWVQVGSTSNEFRLVFGEVVSGTPEEIITREMARVYMTPRVAKALLAILRDNVQKHEKQNGTIELKDVATR
jgi:hypothetical protein